MLSFLHLNLSPARLALYGYRYYDPETGRWASRDPKNEDGFRQARTAQSTFSMHEGKYPSSETNFVEYQFLCNSPIQNYDLLGLELAKDGETTLGGKCEILILIGHGLRDDRFVNGKLKDPEDKRLPDMPSRISPKPEAWGSKCWAATVVGCNTGLYMRITHGNEVSGYKMPVGHIGGNTGRPYPDEKTKAQHAAEDHALNVICKECCCEKVKIKWEGYDGYNGNADKVVPCK